MNPDPAIEAHGLIGDLQTAALVATDGTIDWFCAPRFDSPSIFASILDHRNGGYFRIAPDGSDHGDGARFRSPAMTISVSAVRQDRRLVRPEDIHRTEYRGAGVRHLGRRRLISAAMNLDYQLDHGAGSAEPVLEPTAVGRGG